MKKICLTALLLCVCTVLSSCAKNEPFVPQPFTPPAATEEPSSPVPDSPFPEQEPLSPPEAQTPEPESQIPEKPDYASEILSGMTLEEKVGQMFFVRCPETGAEGLVEKYHLGGYILFGRDFDNQSIESVRSAIGAYQERADIPMLIGVDEEGGSVVRLSRYKAFRSAAFLSPQQLYNKGGFELIVSDTVEKFELLKSLGINFNLAPVCDVSTDPDDYIYQRSFGKPAASTAVYVKYVVEAMATEGIGCALKHFPGYGNNTDTHEGIAYDRREYAVFETSDFLPFKTGIEAGANIVLVSHNIVYCMDDKPASLSKPVHDLLRNELGFDGVIMTDDLYMDAIRDFTGASEAAVAAVEAGNDLLCCTDYEQQITAVITAVKEGRITVERLDESVLRILRMKIKLDII